MQILVIEIIAMKVNLVLIYKVMVSLIRIQSKQNIFVLSTMCNLNLQLKGIIWYYYYSNNLDKKFSLYYRYISFLKLHLVILSPKI